MGLAEIMAPGLRLSNLLQDDCLKTRISSGLTLILCMSPLLLLLSVSSVSWIKQE